MELPSLGAMLQVPRPGGLFVSLIEKFLLVGECGMLTVPCGLDMSLDPFLDGCDVFFRVF